MAEQNYMPNLEERTQAEPSLLTQREQREGQQRMEGYRRKHLYGAIGDRENRARDEVQEFYKEARQVGINGNKLNNMWLHVQYIFGRNPVDVIKAQERKLERLGQKERRRTRGLERERDSHVENYLQQEKDLDEAIEYRGMLEEAMSNMRVEIQGLQQKRAGRPAGKTSLEDQISVAEIREQFYSTQRKERELVNDKARVDGVIERYNAKARALRQAIDKIDFIIDAAYGNLEENVEGPLVNTVTGVPIAQPLVTQVTVSKEAEKQAEEHTKSVIRYQNAAEGLFENARDLVMPKGNGRKTKIPNGANIETAMKQMKEYRESRAAEVDELVEKRRTEAFA